MRTKRRGRTYLHLTENSVSNIPEYLQIGILMDKTKVVLKKLCAEDSNIPLGMKCAH